MNKQPSQGRGFSVSPTAIIRQIRNNLEEGRYARDDSGFTIFKELLQNADDAGAGDYDDGGASFVHFGISSGLLNCEHPLLRSPALYVINDGPFEPQDRENIRRFGENSKSLDSSKIGKFGLGLKSLFHLCEAFFFFYPKEQDGKLAYEWDILNPWSSGRDTDIHSDWDRPSKDDLKAVFGELKPLLKSRKCFSLWVPLRQRSVLAKKAPIATYFPGDETPNWLDSDSLPASLQSVLPLLRHVKSVRGFRGSGESATEVFRLEVTPEFRRRQSLSSLVTTEPHDFSGRVTKNDSGELIYYATERMISDAYLQRLQRSEFWPNDEGLDPKTGAGLQVKEKAEPHGACCVSVAKLADGNRGGLSIGWAVFLPLGKPAITSLPLPFDVSIHLHGYFFTDAGRNGPVGLTDGLYKPEEAAGDRAIKANWNYRLAEFACLPLLPSTLARALKDTSLELPDSLVPSATRAIEESSIYRQGREAICRDHGWALAADEKGTSTWTLIDPDQKLLLLPGTASVSEAAWATFPGLAELSDDYTISFANEPRLCRVSTSVDWPEPVISRLLDSVDAREIASTSERTKFASQFLQFVQRESSNPLAPNVVVEFTRRVLSGAGIERLAAAKDDFRELVRSVPSHLRVALDLDEDHSELLPILLAEKASVVFVPRFLDDAEHPCEGQLTTVDCVSVLRRLEKTQAFVEKEKQMESVSKIAATILSLAQSKSDVVEQCGDLLIFLALDCRQRKNSGTLASWNELSRKRQEQTLFVSPPQQAYKLQDALHDERLLLLNPDVFGLLFPGVESKPVCSLTQVVETISRCEPPKLAAPESRKPLLEAMLDFQGGRALAEYRKCVRYLLHGSQKDFVSDADLLASNSDVTDLWRRVVLFSLEARGAKWRLLDSSLTAVLSGHRRDEFSVRVTDANTAAELFASTEPACFAKLNPSDAEYIELLKAIKDDDVCKSLPIHPTNDSQFVAIGEDCFWQSEMPIPPELINEFQILRLSDDHDTQHRQLRLTRQLDDMAVLQIALKQKEPQKHWRFILDAIAAIGSIPADLKPELANTRWLTMNDGTVICPCDVILLPKLHHQVRKVVASYPGTYFEPSGISQKLLKHPAYDQIEKNCFADLETSLAIVGELLKVKPANTIGRLDESGIENLIEVVGELPQSVLPASDFIAAAIEKYPQDVRALVRELASQPIGKRRILELLDAFRVKHGRATSNPRKKTLLLVFNAYLDMLLDVEGSFDCLLDQRLLSLSGRWTDCRRLAFANDGLSQDSVVNPDIEWVLARHHGASSETSNQAISLSDGSDFDWNTVEESLEQTGDRLKTYFRPWESSIPNEQIGGFLALLGDAHDVRELARQYLGGNRTLEQTRRKFGLEDWRHPTGELREDGLTMIGKQRVVVDIVSTPTVPVANLFGETIDAERNVNPKSIFIGYGRPSFPFPHKIIDGKRVLCFRLNAIDIRQLGPGELADLLRDSCVRLIERAYNQFERQTKFADAWEDLSRSDQLDISIAQARIVGNAFLILEQYGLKSDQKLGPVIRAWDAADKLVAEQSSGVALSESGSRDANKERDQAKEELKELLETDHETQQRVTAAVRQRIEKHYQYTVHSIPFEIFQNADDTCSQLAQHFDDPDRVEAARVFRVVRGEQSIVFVHFGRCINQYPLDRPELRSKFEDDLWSMLVLNLSSKAGDADSAANANVTGKYGLGFKSCYLVSDSPSVISGRLGFEVRGAMYPKRIIENENDETSTLGTVRDQLGVAKRNATLIQFPISRSSTDEVLTRFESLCGYLVVFARHVSTIVIDDEREVSWLPKPVHAVAGGSVGIIDLLDEDAARRKTHALLLRNEFGSLLLRLESEGFSCFDEEVPTIWVTAPTEERLGTGFIVNGEFNIDVGRAQLSRDLTENESIASKLGQKIGQQFIELFSRTTDVHSWQRLISELGLAEDATSYAFFDSLFDLLCNVGGNYSQDPGPKLLHDMIWRDENSCGSTLVSRLCGLPTRIDGEYQTLTSCESVRFLLAGMLESRSDLFERVSQWESFRSNAAIGTVVSRKRVAALLNRRNSHFLSAAKPLCLQEAIEWEIGEAMYCDPDLASRLGQVISGHVVIESDEWGERQDLEKMLRRINFKGRDGKFHVAVKLLCPELHQLGSDFELDPDEEQFRSLFAPSSCLLAEDYDRDGVTFFDACRGRMEAPSRLMAEWVLKARTLPRQKAALQYIAHGQLRQQLLFELKTLGFSKTWLENLGSSRAFAELNENDRWQLRELLPPADRPQIDWSLVMQTRAQPEQLDAGDALNAVHEWWSGNRDQGQASFEGRSYREEFARRTYPFGSLAKLDDDGAEQRRDWVILLLLGLFHTQGRAQPEQHRSFLKRCDDEGWLDLFSASSRNADEWMGFIEGYLDQQVDDAAYWHWMRQFVGIFQVNRHLDDYIECFLAIDRVGEYFSLQQILNTKSSHLFQGGGLDAPPLSRLLGMGACFVVRELVRTGLLTSEFSHPHCFVPTARVRRVFAAIGCEDLEQEHSRWEVSPIIYDFIVDQVGDDRATFSGDFDIPFQFIAEDADLQQRLFQSSLELDEIDDEVDEDNDSLLL